MNTPAHALINCALLKRGPREAVLFGALLPDLPMFVFWMWQVAAGRSQQLIWSLHYFDDAWQGVFDAFNSIPIAALLIVAGWAFGKRALLWGASSALLHHVGDFLLHREDGHRHLFPFSDWRLISPVSYWDPNYFGHWMSALELAASAAAAFYLVKRVTTRAGRTIVVSAWGLLLSGFLFFYAL